MRLIYPRATGVTEKVHTEEGHGLWTPLCGQRMAGLVGKSGGQGWSGLRGCLTEHRTLGAQTTEIPGSQSWRLAVCRQGVRRAGSH